MDGVIAVGGWIGCDCGCGCGCGGRAVVGALGAVSGERVGFSLGNGVGASVDGEDGVEGGVIMRVGVGAVSTIGAGVDGVMGAVVGDVTTMGDTVGAGTRKMGAGVGIVQLGEEQFPNMTNDTVVFDPLAWVQM